MERVLVEKRDRLVLVDQAVVEVDGDDRVEFAVRIRTRWLCTCSTFPTWWTDRNLTVAVSVTMNGPL